MYNKVILIGRLVADPELHKTSTDKSVARATLAVNRRYKDQNGELRTRRYEKNGTTQYVTEVLCQGFQLLESRAQRAMRANGAGGDLADLILEEEELPF